MDPRVSSYKKSKNKTNLKAEEKFNLEVWLEKIKIKKSQLEEIEKRDRREDSLIFIRKEKDISKVAKFFLALGIEEASNVLSLLEENEIVKILNEIVNHQYISSNEKKSILREFEKIIKQEKRKIKVDKNFAFDLLSKTLGKNKANFIYKKVTGEDNFKPFDFLKDLEEEQVFLLLQEESVSTLAIVFIYLSESHKKNLFKRLEVEKKRALVKELAKSKKILNDMIEFISNKMKSKIDFQGKIKTEKIKGAKILADILSYMETDDEKKILNNIEVERELENEIKNFIFSMDIILRISDNDIHNILRDFSEREIALLLRECNEELQGKILSNISKRRKLLVLEESEMLRVINKSELKELISSFLNYIKIKHDAGEITIYRKDEEFIL